MSNQQISNNGDSFIRQSEGSELKIYKDKRGNATGGVGHKLIFPQDQWIIDQGGVLTQDQLEMLFRHDKFTVEVYLNNVIFKNWLTQPTQYEFDALADYVFQYGTSLYNRFPVTFIYFCSGDRDKIVYALRNWFNNDDPKAQDNELFERRTREVRLFRDGHYC